MTTSFACAHCSQIFSVEAVTPILQCPTCGKYMRAEVPEPAPIVATRPASPARAAPVRSAPPPAARRASPAPAPPPPRAPSAGGLQRTCPGCGVVYPVTERGCPGCGKLHVVAAAEREEEAGSAFAPEKRGIDKGVVGGLVMIGIAVVWFVVGYACGRIFYYPPVLAVIGIYGVVKGLATGNISGERSPAALRAQRRRGRPGRARR